MARAHSSGSPFKDNKHRLAAVPVFVLAAGWRSGSTLVQRLIHSSGEVLVWGEPYGRSGIVRALADAWSTLGDEWPPPAAIAPRTLGGLENRWTANLYPSTEELRVAFRAFFHAFLEEPARARGFDRFGLKEVRLGARDAQLLRWVYPSARFCFVVRNPWDAWCSFKGAAWFLRWPDRIVHTPEQFADHWFELARGFRDWRGGNALLLRYEDLIRDPGVLENLRGHAELAKIEESVLNVRIRGVPAPPRPSSEREIDVIRQRTAPVAAHFGYHGPSAGQKA